MTQVYDKGIVISTGAKWSGEIHSTLQRRIDPRLRMRRGSLDFARDDMGMELVLCHLYCSEADDSSLSSLLEPYPVEKRSFSKPNLMVRSVLRSRLLRHVQLVRNYSLRRASMHMER